ncbi:DUF4279 domain-containing protein [Dactylosporangium sp. NPDC000521]|uniref:DUF4279 domain-containing protein n=1 Tax=Dactylosporangium sp. NPDC000521 TaxID=3363975 RepID=UPI0036B56C19
MGAGVGWTAGGVMRGRCVQRAHLSVTVAEGSGVRDLDPAEVTRLVGLVPTSQHRKGDPCGPFQGVWRHSGWEVEVPERDEFDTDVVLVELLDIIEPYADGLARARRVLGLDAAVHVVIEMYRVHDPDSGEDVLTTPALWLSAETIRRLAKLDLWIECDQYVF